MEKRNIILSILGIAILTLTSFAATYAYFVVGSSNGRSADIKTETGNLVLVLDDVNGITVNDQINPNHLSFTKTFSISNTSVQDGYADLLFKDLVNTYSEYLVYSLEEVQSNGTSYVTPRVVQTEKAIPKSLIASDKILVEGLLIEKGTKSGDTITPNTKYYKLTVRYIYSTEINQSADLNSSLTSGFMIVEGSPKSRVISCVNDNNETIPCPSNIVAGTKISIGETNPQRFYVISNNNGTIRALSEYNLNVGNKKNTSIIEGLQYENARGYVKQAKYPNAYNGGTYYGTVAFNADGTQSTNYLDYQGTNIESGYSDYTVSNIKGYVDAYLTKLNGSSYGNELITNADLISYNELVNLGCSGNSCSSSLYLWVYSTSYWSGSAASNSALWGVYSYSSFNNFDYARDSAFGVRPVISFNASLLS